MCSNYNSKLSQLSARTQQIIATRWNWNRLHASTPLPAGTDHSHGHPHLNNWRRATDFMVISKQNGVIVIYYWFNFVWKIWIEKSYV